MDFDAVLFDMGGVIITGPFAGFARYEREAGLPEGLIRQINATNADDNAWAHYERGAIDRAEFVRRFEAEAAARGHTVDAARVLDSMRGQPVPEMVDVIRALSPCVALGMITNNLAPVDWAGSSIAAIAGCFAAIVESSREGVRKPDAAIYTLTCERLDVAPERCVFLDDLGVNLKPARALGMHTIKVIDPVVAAHELRRLFDL